VKSLKPEFVWTVGSLVIATVAGNFIRDNLWLAAVVSLLSVWAAWKSSVWTKLRLEFFSLIVENAPNNARDFVRIKQVRPKAEKVIAELESALRQEGVGYLATQILRQLSHVEFVVGKFGALPNKTDPVQERHNILFGRV
jgi:hypothetical protein